MKLPLRLAALVAASALLAPPSLALDTRMQVVLDLDGDVQRTVSRYECEGAEPFTVEYVNAKPVFLAFVPVNGEKLVFVNVIAASGARYASGQYVWWTRGPDADLYDVTAGEDAAPILTCLEATETP